MQQTGEQAGNGRSKVLRAKMIVNILGKMGETEFYDWLVGHRFEDEIDPLLTGDTPHARAMKCKEIFLGVCLSVLRLEGVPGSGLLLEVVWNEYHSGNWYEIFAAMQEFAPVVRKANEGRAQVGECARNLLADMRAFKKEWGSLLPDEAFLAFNELVKVAALVAGEKGAGE